MVPVEVTDYGKGQLNVTYTAELAGSYIIEAKINGVAQPELEGRVMISPTVPDCSKCKVPPATRGRRSTCAQIRSPPAPVAFPSAVPSPSPPPPSCCCRLRLDAGHRPLTRPYPP